MIDKQQLYNKCLDFVQSSIEQTEHAIKEAQGASNEESKSTAGDKHDTARAMMQIEVNKLSRNLATSLKSKKTLQTIDPTATCKKITLGAAVKTSNANYYFSIPAGQIEDEWYALSLSAPIGQALKGLSIGELAEFNGNQIEILEIY